MVVVVGGARVAEVVREDEAGEAAEAEGEDSRRRTLIAQSLGIKKIHVVDRQCMSAV